MQPSETTETAITAEASVVVHPDQLPIAEARDKLIEEMRNNPTLIIIGETGCGKTTQVPKYILHGRLNKKRLIAITQPRRVAAVSLARRVAEELGEEVGGTVGYAVRFEERTSEQTRIKFMTDGMLLREGLQDPLFQKYSYIVLDEAHERTINTDLLVGLVKGAQRERSSKKPNKRLKVLVMSATMDVDKFGRHFENSKVVFIEGRQHDVSIFQSISPQDDYCTSTIAVILKLHVQLPLGQNILAFLTGQYEIDSVVNTLRSMESNEAWDAPMEVCPLYAALSQADQMKVLTRTPPGSRRVIVSTNIAETSLTIPGVKVVIDCGFVKAKFHEYGLSLDTLGVIRISKAQAMQRAGRAGRESKGTCYRLYTKEFFAEMDDNTVPEIKRVQMSRCILHLLKIGIQNPFTFDWIDPPTDTATLDALVELADLEAITVIKMNPEEKTTLNVETKITELGSQMVSIPLEPVFARVLLKSKDFGVVEATACILAILSSENIFRGREDKAYKARLKFSEPEGDLIMYLKIFREFRKSKSKHDWCKQNALNHRALAFALKVRDHLVRLCQEEGIDTQKCVSWDDTKENIRKCFHQCMKENIAVLSQGKGNDYLVSRGQKLPVKIHPTSSLHNKGCPIVHFTEMTQVASGTSYIKHVTALNSRWI